MAHVFKYRLQDTINFLDTLKQNNIIDGVEVYHSSFTKEQIETLEKYCRDNNLLMWKFKYKYRDIKKMD